MDPCAPKHFRMAAAFKLYLTAFTDVPAVLWVEFVNGAFRSYAPGTVYGYRLVLHNFCGTSVNSSDKHDIRFGETKLLSYVGLQLRSLNFKIPVLGNIDN